MSISLTAQVVSGDSRRVCITNEGGYGAVKRIRLAMVAVFAAWLVGVIVKEEGAVPQPRRP